MKSHPPSRKEGEHLVPLFFRTVLMRGSHIRRSIEQVTKADFEPSRPILCDLVRRERPPKSSALFNFLADVGGMGMSCV